jgi:hypothetical protein
MRLRQEVVRGVVGLEAFKDGFGAVDDGVGESGEAGDLNAVGTIGGTFGDLTDEDDFVVPFFDNDGVVLEAVKGFGELGEFVVMGGERGCGGRGLRRGGGVR